MVDWHRNTHPSREGGEHIPAQPFWIAIIRVIQALFNLLVLALAANAANYFYLDGYGMAFFTFVWTVVFLLYIFLTPRFAPHFYHFWGHVAAEILTVIWWLVTFALLANYTRAWSYWGGYWRSGMADSTRAATAFAVLNWILFCITLGATIFLNRGATVDSAHTHSHATSPTTTTTTGGGGLGTTGARFKSFFSRKPAATDVEKNGATASTGTGTGVPSNEQPVELNEHGHATANNGTNGYDHNGVGGGYGGAGYTNGGGSGPIQAPPPTAGAPHYGPEGQSRY